MGGGGSVYPIAPHASSNAQERALCHAHDVKDDMGLRLCAATVLGAAAALLLTNGAQREKPVLAVAGVQPVSALEAAVASNSNDVESTRALAQAYVDATLPGLAAALVDGAPPIVRNDVRVEHVVARALVDEGRNAEALAVERRVVASCTVAEDGHAAAECDAVLYASALRRASILRECLSMGIDDARSNPELTLVAYQNATREARVAVE
jgi:hypothetical protein